MTHMHILGICGTFMGGLAQLAKASGLAVSGCDQNVYPPMSEQLQQAGIELMQGYDPAHLDRCNNGKGPDYVVVGNAIARGNPVIESVLNRGIPYISGPQWLAENILAERWVLAVAGTHGKTTTSSMLAWILESAGLNPGFLIGGVPGNFSVSARLGASPFFVIEADEYDTAFFDKRSKFVHYRPRTLVLNNLEFDHADIFPDVLAIQRQFHHLVRTVAGEGRIIANASDSLLDEVLRMGCWTPVEKFALQRSENSDWYITRRQGAQFEVTQAGAASASGELNMAGDHNLSNALAAVVAACHAGVLLQHACAALQQFTGVKRRLEMIGKAKGITVYDDFAHHPTAISETLKALRRIAGKARVIALLELRSNSMRMGVHNANLPAALALSDQVYIYHQDKSKSGCEQLQAANIEIFDDIEKMLNRTVGQSQPGDHIVLMSNGSFEGAHTKLLTALQ